LKRADLMSFYEEYKPFRNYLRRFDLVQSLADIWRYSLHIVEGQPLPAGYVVGRNPVTDGLLNKCLYAWDLARISHKD